jgi:prephenate dehydrogenase
MSAAGIIGTGLIGGSIGLGLRTAGWAVAGWDPDPAALAQALAAGALDETVETRDGILQRETDLLVLAGPPAAVIADLPDLETMRLTIDVAGVKAPVVEAARHLPRFVPTHPMAGREVGGAAAATSTLFRGAAWVVVTDGAAETDLVEVERVITLLGARPVRMTAADHDHAVAAISHLPQVVAATLLEEAGGRADALELAAGSFRDLTRVAASDPESWTQLLLANDREVTAVLRDLARRLETWAGIIERHEGSGLLAALTAARRARHLLAPQVMAIRVALADQPGEIARVGHALETSGADVRDLQLRHAPFGGGGVLTLSVRPGDADRLRAALTAEGLILAD